jgi:penicillin-binding protein 2
MGLRAEHQFFGHRLKIAQLVTLSVMSLLVMRLWYLQGIHGSYFRDLSENNRIRTLRTVAARGTVYDREGKILVGNRPSFQVAIIPEDVRDLKETIRALSELSGRPVEELDRQLESQRGRYHFEPRVVIADATREELARVKVNSYRLPGVIVEVVPTRNYPETTAASQLLGYSREITRNQLEANVAAGYKRGDVYGQSGLERFLEKELRGTSGYRQVEVDAMGHRKSELGDPNDLPGTPGKDIQLSIDVDLQHVAEKALEGRKGAVVALDPNTGDVLVLASAPVYDANIFSGQVLSNAWQSLSTDRSEPLHNRGISEVYPPGSTFKLIMSVAALASGKATEHTAFNCPGYYQFGSRKYRCHKASGHGLVDMKRALTVSCNAYYFQLGQLLGIDIIEKYGKLLGLGEKTGIELPGETTGIIPSDSWKRSKFGQQWYPGDTLSVSIGQGYVVVSPIQMAVAVSAIANGGSVYRPRLVQRITNRITNETVDYPPELLRTLDVSKKVFPLVRDFAAAVVADDRGTGRAARIDGVTVGGKTGTAQVSALGKEHLAEHLKDHAWFVSFAPVENPQIVTAVIVENSGHGGQFAAPVARKVYEEFFRKKGILAPVAVEPVIGAPPEDATMEGDAGVDDPVETGTGAAQ